MTGITRSPLLPMAGPVRFGAGKKAIETVVPSFETTGGSGMMAVMDLLGTRAMDKGVPMVIRDSQRMKQVWDVLKQKEAAPTVDFGKQAVVVVGLGVPGGSTCLSRENITFNPRTQKLTVELKATQGMGTMVPKSTWYLAVVDKDKAAGSVEVKIQ